MAWFVLVIAGLLEVVWAYSMKVSEGFTKLTPAVLTIIFMIASFALLSYAMKSLPLGTAYTVWTGIGAVGVATLGVVLFSESASPARLGCIALIVAGVVGLKLFSPA